MGIPALLYPIWLWFLPVGKSTKRKGRLGGWGDTSGLDSQGTLEPQTLKVGQQWLVGPSGQTLPCHSWCAQVGG